jgi:hypothetical protein
VTMATRDGRVADRDLAAVVRGGLSLPQKASEGAKRRRVEAKI